MNAPQVERDSVLRAYGIEPEGWHECISPYDAVIHPIQVSRPEWCAAFDLRPEQAVTTRRELLARAADEGMLLHGAHFPWPGLGHVVRQDQGFRWEPIHTPPELRRSSRADQAR